MKGEEEPVQKTTEKYSNLSRTFNERFLRLWASNKSLSIGYDGKTLVSYEVVVNHIENTRMDKRLRVEWISERNQYGGGNKINNGYMPRLSTTLFEFHCELNYTINLEK
jgi:hypothetical protein